MFNYSQTSKGYNNAPLTRKYTKKNSTAPLLSLYFLRQQDFKSTKKIKSRARNRDYDVQNQKCPRASCHVVKKEKF